MICKFCGGRVTWRGPMTALAYTQCESCGAQNCEQEEEPDGEDGSEVTA